MTPATPAPDNPGAGRGTSRPPHPPRPNGPIVADSIPRAAVPAATGPDRAQRARHPPRAPPSQTHPPCAAAPLLIIDLYFAVFFTTATTAKAYIGKTTFAKPAKLKENRAKSHSKCQFGHCKPIANCLLLRP